MQKNSMQKNLCKKLTKIQKVTKLQKVTKKLHVRAIFYNAFKQNVTL